MNYNKSGEELVLPSKLMEEDKYFHDKFLKFENHDKKKGNWAAFFLGYVYLIYRKMYKEWLILYLPSLIAMVAFMIMQKLVVKTFDSELLSFNVNLFFIIVLYNIILAFVLRKKFNKIYYKKVSAFIKQENIMGSNIQSKREEKLYSKTFGTTTLNSIVTVIVSLFLLYISFELV